MYMYFLPFGFPRCLGPHSALRRLPCDKQHVHPTFKKSSFMYLFFNWRIIALQIFVVFSQTSSLVNCQYFSYRFQLFSGIFGAFILSLRTQMFLGSCLASLKLCSQFLFLGLGFYPWQTLSAVSRIATLEMMSMGCSSGSQGPSLGVSCHSAGQWACWPLLARPGVQMWPRPRQISASLALEAKRTICCPICARSSLLEFGQWYTAAENDVKDHES